MKKTLIALAAVAATGAAFAQSSVTLKGTFDPSYQNIKKTYGNGSSVSQNEIGNNAQGTSQITFVGVEDLGGGLKAEFLFENDFHTRYDARGPAGAVAGNVNNSAGAAGTNFGTSGGEQYTALTGGFGSVKLGAANTPSLTSQTGASVFGTKVGGGFGTASTGHVRNSNSIVYGSPSFGGLTVGLGYAFKVKADSNGTAANVVAESANHTDIGVNYVAGPIAAGYTNYVVAATASANKQTQNNFYATYDLGMAKLGFGYYTDKRNAFANANAIDSKAYVLTANVPLNASTNLLISRTSKDDKTGATGTNNQDRTITAIGLKYTMSKRTSVYARYVDDKTKNIAATTAATGNALKSTRTTLAGIQHNF